MIFKLVKDVLNLSALNVNVTPMMMMMMMMMMIIMDYWILLVFFLRIRSFSCSQHSDAAAPLPEPLTQLTLQTVENDTDNKTKILIHFLSKKL